MGGGDRLGSLSVEEKMAVGEAGPNRMKAAAPYVGAGAAVLVAIGAAVSLGNGGTRDAPASGAMAPSDASTIEPATAAPPATSADPQAPQASSAIPGVAQAPATSAPTAGGAQMGIEIVVKFKDDGKVKDIIDAFWKDEASARAKFEALKARRPELASLRLDRVTYSNELVLVDDGSAPAAQRVSAVRSIAAKLKDVSDISYAEPNMTAHPGGR